MIRHGFLHWAYSSLLLATVALLLPIPARAEWASLNTLGSSQEKINDTTLTLAVTAAVETDNVIMVLIAFDNKGTADGDNAAINAVTDAAGNTYTKIREFENAQGSAAAGAGVSVWLSKVSDPLAGGAAITVTFAAATGAKAMSAWEFSTAPGETISVYRGIDLAEDGTSDPASMNLTPPGDVLLFVRAIANEGSETTQLTPTGGYTAFTHAQTSGGGAATNIGVRGEFRISPLIGFAISNPTWALSNRDIASTFVAFRASPTGAYRTLFGVGR